ncbi:PEP-CTERM sorting domain-containing protein [Botrimarina sp.]|uniref:PEP-CTERM sorting domain-containing protein n=1 Tax=Botrimarina sp. TaxID=2795802 RepID=UPI0032EB9C08
MSWKSFACLAAVAAMSAPALAQPSFTTNGSILQVTVDAMGSVAVEVSITGSDIAPASGMPADTVFDTPNPGDNPFTGTVTNGAFVDGNNIFISYGSDVLSPGTYDLWDFTGTGTADVMGLIAQGGANFTGLTATLTLGGLEPVAGDFSGDGNVDNDDLTLLLDNWAATVPPVPAGWDGAQPTSPAIDNSELTALLDTWGTSAGGAAVGVPEPAALGLVMVGLLGAAARRKV